MKFLITKTCRGFLDTAKERARIEKCFADDPVTQKKLNLLMDAIEAREWKEARKMLDSDWWKGRDKKHECPRWEFIGLLDLKDPDRPTNLHAAGFDTWASYDSLVDAMVDEECSVEYAVVPIKALTNIN